VIKAVRRAKLFVFLRLHRHELFDEQFQAELAQAYVDSPKGQPPVPPDAGAAATAAGASRMIRELSKGGMMTVSAVRKASGPCSTVIEKSALVRTGDSRRCRSGLRSGPLRPRRPGSECPAQRGTPPRGQYDDTVSVSHDRSPSKGSYHAMVPNGGGSDAGRMTNPDTTTMRAISQDALTAYQALVDTACAPGNGSSSTRRPAPSVTSPSRSPSPAARMLSAPPAPPITTSCVPSPHGLVMRRVSAVARRPAAPGRSEGPGRGPHPRAAGRPGLGTAAVSRPSGRRR
jgi:hypothetical protein